MMDKGGMGRSKVCCRRAGGVAMGAPQIADAPAAWTTSRERILPVMRYWTPGSAEGAEIT